MARAKTLPTSSSTSIPAHFNPAYPTGPVDEYAEAVIKGDIVAGPHVRNACMRHRNDRANGPARGIHWDPEAADRVLRFFPAVLRLNGGQFEARAITAMQADNDALTKQLQEQANAASNDTNAKRDALGVDSVRRIDAIH